MSGSLKIFINRITMMIMKIGKKEQPPVRELFHTYSSLLKDAFYATANALTAFSDQNSEEMVKSITLTIQLEKEHDRMREQIIERIFSRETMVFSREDRLNLVDELDDIVDKAEIVVRKLSAFEVSLPDELGEKVRQIALNLRTLGDEMNALIHAVLENFEDGKPHIITIQDVRRIIRELHWELMQDIYSLNSDFKTFYYLETLVKAMCNVADETEELSDKIYGLICKYTF